MLKKLLRVFEILIVPHALHCIDVFFCILPHLTVRHTVLVSAQPVFCILPHLTVWHTVLVSAQPPSPLIKNNLILFKLKIKMKKGEKMKWKKKKKIIK